MTTVYDKLSGSKVSEVSKEIKKLIQLGYESGAIYKAIKTKFDYINELDTKIVEAFIITEVKAFNGYSFIQKVKHGIILSPSNAKNWYLYDVVSKAKEVVIESDIYKLVKFEWTNKLLPCVFEYHPHTKADVYEENNKTIFNTYVPPFWKFRYHYNTYEVPETTLPEVYQQFFNHLFKGDVLSINYVLDWLSTALKSRNQTYLVTLGAAGAGKGTLGDIMKALVGQCNYSHVAFQSITKQFNSTLKDKQIIYFDEVKVTKDVQEDLLLMLVNNSIEIEQKNVDSKIIKNYSSVYLSSNHYNSLKIKADDRRFSITELTDVPFKTAFDDDFRGKLFEDSNIAELGKFLLNRKVDLNKMRTPFVSSKTQLARQSCLSEWQDVLLNSICFESEGKFLTITQLNEKIKIHTDSDKIRVTTKALSNLNALYPGFYTVKREIQGTRRVWVINIKPLAEQPTHLLEDLTVTEEV